MKKTKFKLQTFNVIVNPFLRKATIKTKIDGVEYETTLSYTDTDEWDSFNFVGNVFDIHFLYDAEFLVEIYTVENNVVDYTKQHKVKLKFKMTD